MGRFVAGMATQPKEDNSSLFRERRFCEDAVYNTCITIMLSISSICEEARKCFPKAEVVKMQLLTMSRSCDLLNDEVLRHVCAHRLVDLSHLRWHVE